MRNIKEKEIDFDFNNTLYNINKSKNNYTINDPFQIFNSDRLKNLNFVFRFIIKPSYLNLTSNIQNYIVSTKNVFKIIIIILLAFYLGMITFIYLVIWREFENNLNSKVIKYIHLFFNYFNLSFRYLKIKICLRLFQKKHWLV